MTEPNGNTDWRRGVVSKARAEVRKLERPEGCSQQRWRCVTALLAELARFLPDPYPHQRTLCLNLGVGERTLKRWVSWAVELGLLETSPGPSAHGYWSVNRYHLVGISTGGHIGPPTGGHIGPQSTPIHTYGSRELKHSDPTGLRTSEESKFTPPPGGVGKVSMSDLSDLGPGVGDDSSELVVSKGRDRPTPRPRTPAAQVMRHFEAVWEAYIATSPGRYHSMAVLFSNKAAFMRRVKEDLIERDGRSVEDICASFDLFVRKLSARVEGLKPQQDVWKRWWSQRATYLATVTPTPHAARSERPPEGWSTEANKRLVDEPLPPA